MLAACVLADWALTEDAPTECALTRSRPSIRPDLLHNLCIDSLTVREPAMSVATIRLAAAVFAAFISLASAQNQSAATTPAEPYAPQSGQPGKDVVWVPTSQIAVDKMMEMAKVTAADVVMDLGSGDGRTVITAAKLGARALGIEYNPDMV